MLKKYIIIVLKRFLLNIGFEVKRIEVSPQSPSFFDDAGQALLFSQGGKKSAFSCPVQLCTHHTGIGFSASDWNPFIETIKQFEEDDLLIYENSILNKFYQNWAPKSAEDAIIEFTNSPKSFAIYPPHHLFLSPWTSLSHSEVDQDTRWWNQKDNIEHGGSHLRFPEDGWAFSGPVHQDKGRLEFDRIINLYLSIKKNGYDRTKGFIGVTQLKRDNEYRYLVGGGGYHRAVVMAALGFETFPARYHRNSVVDINDVENWPQVKNGIWSREQALKYVDHLFDISSRNWAQKIGLI